MQNAFNSRPLTYREFDLNNFDVVTPNSFLKPGMSCELAFGNVAASEVCLKPGVSCEPALGNVAASQVCLKPTLEKRD